MDMDTQEITHERDESYSLVLHLTGGHAGTFLCDDDEEALSLAARLMREELGPAHLARATWDAVAWYNETSGNTLEIREIAVEGPE